MARLGDQSFSVGAPGNDEFSPIPAGRYNLMVTNSDYLANKAMTGHYLKIEAQVIDGDYINRKIWTMFNIDHPNEKAVEIAQRELSDLLRACGLQTIEDSEELHGIPFSAQVKIRPERGEYAASNTMSAYKAPVDSDSGLSESPPWA